MSGNVFKDDAGSILTVDINKKDVLPTVQWLEKITGLELTDYMLGTTGRSETSGDLDLAIDSNKVDKSEFAQKLMDYIAKDGGDPKQWVKKSGISVHFKTPIKGDDANGYVQADFMFGEPSWLKWSMTGGKEGSNLKGRHRHIILASIAKAKGMKWSFQNGLMNRETNETLTKDPREIAKKLLGLSATEKNLEDPEAIIDYVIRLPNYEELVKDARETLEKEGVELPLANQLENYTPGTSAWFRKMIEVVNETQFNSKQEVIAHFVKMGKSAAAGASAWERGWRGHTPKKKELRPPVRNYHDDLDDKRYGENN